jgi:polysaccharide biosynthesis protein PelA
MGLVGRGIELYRKSGWNPLPLLRLLALSVAVPALICARSRWIVYYSDQVAAEELRDYSLLVFDSGRHPPLPPLAARKKILLGYLSLGEVNAQCPYFPSALQAGFLLGENPAWPGSRYVDVRDRRWRELVVGKLAPEILAQGFQGLFLDTLDDPAELERRDAAAYSGMTAASVELVQALRKAFPSIKIMMNRGYEILPQVGGVIDMELGESVYATYDFNRKVYQLAPAKEYQQQVRALQQAKRRNAALGIYSLDYWDPTDRTGIRRIYRQERANGLAPSVSWQSQCRLPQRECSTHAARHPGDL